MTADESDRLTLTRRELFKRSGVCIGAIALGSILRQEINAVPAVPAPNPLAPRPPHFAPKATRVIYLHMVGAPSQLDLFDYKPTLNRRDGELCPKEFIEGKRFAFLRGHPRLLGSKFKFERQGQSGAEFSELLPYLRGVADELAIIKSMHTDEFNHGPAQLLLHTGSGRPGRPSFGSWVTYGLGTENQDLPAYVVMVSGAMAGGGSSLWGTGFLPSVYQGVQFRSGGDPVLFLSNPKGHDRDDRRRVLDTVEELNSAQLADVGDPEISTRIAQYEMAFRMQTSVPELMDISTEGPATLEAYGAKLRGTPFANNCILARRLIERGVRVVELYDQGWDHHGNIFAGLPRKCGQVDQPIAALIADLKQRGLLDETLVIFGGEFGRTPMRQGGNGANAKMRPGRDHHSSAYTMWMAGGGSKRGITVGATDEFGYGVVDNPVHVHDFNATVLHLLGLDHEQLTFKYQGRDFRLTDVAGSVVKPVLA